ncbi:FAD-binding protein [Nocardia noduli]|uniref:FAD-binding protein n=1 Tax=Nocardia noduli TaxID=2815722 RepID=UPI001C21DFDD|nr:FAD-binding protein [Nocardia noduli]
MSRRRMLAGTAAVIGFDIVAGQWITHGTAAAQSPFDDVPELDGELLLDNGARAGMSTDRGQIVSRMPAAVLRPGSATDIQKMIRFCCQRRIPVSARGDGHATHGQSLTDGLAIETRSLTAIHEISDDHVVVDPGIFWGDLAVATYNARRRTPPVIPTITKLTVGGTLSVGGAGANVHFGLQTDNVLELDVVDGTGTLRTCSATLNRDLFEAVLGGLGQFGVIVRATIPLIPAPTRVREWRFNYLSTADHVADTRLFTLRGELDEVHSEWLPGSTGPVRLVTVAKYFEPGAEPDGGHYLRGGTIPGVLAIQEDYNWLPYLLRSDALVDPLVNLGYDQLLKPWFDVMLPDSVAADFIAAEFPEWAPEIMGLGVMDLKTVRRSRVSNPMFRLPDPDGSDLYHTLSVLRTSLRPGPDPAYVEYWLTRNRQMYERARALGAVRYPADSQDFTTADWAAEYGDRWPELVARKRRYDPESILGIGVDMFAGA